MSTEQSAESLLRRGEACLSDNQPADAKALFEQALGLRPKESAAWRGLGKAQLDLGETDLARQSFATALAIVPYDRYAAHMLAALSGQADRRAAGYVADLFDTYADQFDGHLTDTLGYRIPQVIADLLADRGPFKTMLDLGCGTGLVGATLANVVTTMDGIDIAPKMTRKAHERGIYRHLRTGDTRDILATDNALAGPYDLVTAADVFVYVGPLEATFASVAKILGAKGLFVFSVEDEPGEEIVLRSSGRFAHPQRYVERQADNHGFAIRERLSHPIRQERDRPIPGMLYLMTRAG
ncbi:methyltransferase domain-containing protein [Devosia sp. BSSL-BM10]|uniref:Methyltransferase domain-containing protein n=1 Tax=Devosia litorisediminis TaxID=2829817 RepID=A0A942E3S6_9HYPH|nr:methyltransferase domain-containing protein [Devosia litorisediminis]MBS3847678.1 methyltransferase domain-containing protein [Devosia litorisediminis]